MAEARPVIVTCAITGAIHTPSMSPHLPVSVDAIVAAALGAAQAGATVLRLHARGEDGRPDQSVEALRRVVEPVRAATDAPVNAATGGRPYMAVAERARPAAELAPDLASLDMGLFPMLQRHPEIAGGKREHPEGPRDLVFRDGCADIAHVLDARRPNGTRFELERTTRRIPTTSPTPPRRAPWSRPSSSGRSSASSAGSAPTPTTWPTCAARRSASSATAWSGRRSARGRIRWA